MSEWPITTQQQKLFDDACKWFEMACSASERGDWQTHRVASLAHEMTRRAYANTVRPEPSDEA